jgi:hypothetical protein
MGGAGQRVEEVKRYLEEGRALIVKDSVRASEKLYKVAREVAKALAECAGSRTCLGG